MNPRTRDVHVDQILTNISIAYRNRLYIADRIFPEVRVDKQSDKYYIFPLEEWFRDEAQKRAPGGRSVGGGFPLSTESYFAEEVAYHTLLEDEVSQNADAVLRMETAKTNFVTEKILLNREIKVADVVFEDANWENSITLSGEDQWDDYDNSDPIGVLEDGIDKVEEETGQLVNTIVMGREVWRKLKHHPQLLDRLPTTGLKTATLETLRQLLQDQGEDQIQLRIYVGAARKNDNARGATTQDLSPIWGKHLWLGHVAGNPGREIPSAGYTFVWPENGQVRGVRRWRDEDHHSDKIEAFTRFDQKVTGKALGYLVENAVS